jgi:hypothetical protein
LLRRTPNTPLANCTTIETTKPDYSTTPSKRLRNSGPAFTISKTLLRPSPRGGASWDRLARVRHNRRWRRRSPAGGALRGPGIPLLLGFATRNLFARCQWTLCLRHGVGGGNNCEKTSRQLDNSITSVLNCGHAGCAGADGWILDAGFVCAGGPDNSGP